MGLPNMRWGAATFVTWGPRLGLARRLGLATGLGEPTYLSGDAVRMMGGRGGKGEWRAVMGEEWALAGVGDEHSVRAATSSSRRTGGLGSITRGFGWASS